MPLATWSGALPPDMRLPAPPKAPVFKSFTTGKENQPTNEVPHPNIAAAGIKLWNSLNSKTQAHGDEVDTTEVKLESKSCFLEASDEGAYLATPEEVLQPPLDQQSEEDLEVLQPPLDEPSEEDLERDGFERRLESGDGDIVGTWCEYVQWVSQRAPKSTEESTVLRRACTSLVEEAQHRDDIRYLRLWVRRAACEAEPHVVFNLLEQHDIGSRHALRYEATAAELERSHRFPEAEAQYALGLKLGAEPLDRLKSRFKEFQDRMQKRAARKHGAQKKLKVSAEAGAQRRTMETQPTGRPELQQVPRTAQPPDHQPPPKTLSPLGDCSQALAEDVSWEEEQAARVLARLNQSPAVASRAQVAAPLVEEAACLDSDNRTQELTTSGVLALLGDDTTGARSSRRSSAASGFFGTGEDATYTTELAKREVLELLAHDPDHRSRRSRGDEGSALQPLIHVGMSETCQARSFPLCSQLSGRNPTSSPAFEIFEESD
eukprot:TRINITY_DN15059_c0_g1_i1.p1 TRINITY_DN15059_c0_g1~~TRINITY_DN15059_c0_g1_i1.p1  ORF type:complete len:536 (+),score=108.27 TRINITY_DN15059_c0_g1_i1:141-1610(+)